MIILTPITSGSKIFFSATLALAFHVVLFGLIPEGRALPAKMILSPYSQVLDVNLVPSEPVVRERVPKPVREKVDRTEREVRSAPARVPDRAEPSRERIARIRTEAESRSQAESGQPIERKRKSEVVRKKAPRPEERRTIEKKTAPDANEGVTRTVSYTVDESRIIYPRFAREAGMEGRVVLSIQVSAEGRVRDIKVIESSGHSHLDRSACRQVKEHVVFRPALSRGKLVPGWVDVALNFSLIDASVSTTNG